VVVAKIKSGVQGNVKPKRAKWSDENRANRAAADEEVTRVRLDNALAANAVEERSTYGQRRQSLRKADIGYYLALFPDETRAKVCARFGIHLNTLDKWEHDDIFAAGFERGVKARQVEIDEAARGFFKSRLMDYVGRLDGLAMQDEDKRTALAALTRILESQGTLEVQRQSIVNIAIQMQRGLEAAEPPRISLQGQEVISDGKERNDAGERRALAPQGRDEVRAGQDEAEDEDAQRQL